jgi:hypothetical protein
MNEQICNKCKQPRSVTDFSMRVKRSGIRHRICRVCHSTYRKSHYLTNREKYKRKALRWNKAHPLQKVHRELLAGNVAVGPLKEFEAKIAEMRIAQGGVCAICKNKNGMKQLCVDHCHKTFLIRGLLCSSCNVSLGGFRDSVEILTNAIKYLEHGGVS